jgi:iron complex outermembrane receptor protein
MDYCPNKEDTLTVQGDLLNGVGGERNRLAIPTPPFFADTDSNNSFPEGNVLLRYSRSLDEDTSWQIFAYYDHFTTVTTEQLTDANSSYDIDFQYQFSPWDGHSVITGANYRNTRETFAGTFFINFTPPQQTIEWANWFIQDTVALKDDLCYFTAGVRLEWNTFGGLQAEPTARLLILPSERQSLWLAISRAARNPAVNEETINLKPNAVPGAPVFLDILGNRDLVPEDLVAYEIGYRAAPTDNFTWDIAGYINDYNKLIGSGTGAPAFIALPPPTFVGVALPLPFENNTSARTYGFETTATYKCGECWKLFGSYSLFEINANSSVPLNLAVEGSSPHNMIDLMSSYDIGCWQFDLLGRYVDALTSQNIPSYFEVDARIGCQVTKNMDVSIVGQNLCNSHHLEFSSFNFPVATEVRRSWYGMLTWKF